MRPTAVFDIVVCLGSNTVPIYTSVTTTLEERSDLGKLNKVRSSELHKTVVASFDLCRGAPSKLAVVPAD